MSRSIAADGLKQGSVDLQHDLDATLAFLRTNAVGDDHITVAPLAITPTCGGNGGFYDGKSCGPNPVTGFTLSQGITVESPKVTEVTGVSQLAGTKLPGAGILFTTDSLEYYYSKLSDLKLDMLTDATTNARNRADKIASSTGRNLGVLQSANMGVFQVTAVNSTDISDYGTYDTASIQKNVTGVLHAAFSLK